MMGRPRRNAGAEAGGPAARDAEDPALEWSFNPWRQDAARALAGAVAIVAVGVLLAALRVVPAMSALLVVAFAVSLGPAWLKAHCRVDHAGVARRLALGWERRAWSELRRAVVRRDGLFVSSLAGAGVLASFRGLWLPVPAEARDALIPELRRRVAAHGL
jgi:hypothetical protein